ncbi:putative integral membrane protein [Snodgrassella communis]|uniref:Putative integral membrane protein n=2 Tax=Snodgrassella communis TaxID=2946699 RepID=A0A836MRJ9_9NEIS|nr:putative integral membrane protein [Snodgrassella communis]KDN14762.1 putative integral membrane protein [Snodgrassella communis]
MLGHPINEIYTWGDWTINFAVLAIGFVVWIASLSLLFRRLHDTNRSAWWILISLVPLIGQIWLVILTLLPSKPNRFHQGFF